MPDHETRKRARYVAPPSPMEIGVDALLSIGGRSIDDARSDLFRKAGEAEPIIFYAGDLTLLERKCVSVIGARNVTTEGKRRALRVARELSSAGIVVTSGLALGVDEAAHEGAMAAGGCTVAVIGTPLNKAYPAEHADLQEDIWREHLLVSQFRPGTRTFPSDFPKRNRLMAAITDASVIVEASDTSGTLHQAVECARLGRWLFIMKSVVDDASLEWPRKFLGHDKVQVLESTSDVLEAIS